MALEVAISLDEKPRGTQSNPENFLFAPERIAKLYEGDKSLQFLNAETPGFTLSIPMYIRGGMPGKRIVMPAYIPYFSMDLQVNPTLSTAKKTSVLRHVSTAVAQGINDLKPALVELNFLPFYWLPFHWEGYEVRPRVTYRLETAHLTPQKLKSQFRDNIQRQIKKSVRENNLFTSDNCDALFALNKDSYERKGDDHPFEHETLNRLFKLLNDEERVKIVEVHNGNGEVIAAAMFAWDASRVYYLTGGVRASDKSSGAMAHVLWEGIQLAREHGLNFDFEGSMNQGIERFFSAFGATSFTYYQVRKMNSKLYDIYQKVRS